MSMKTAEAERRYWTHSCRERGNWRWWLHGPRHDVMHAEVSWRARLTGLWLGRSDEGKWHASIGLYWLYATIGWRPAWAKYTGAGSSRQISVTFHDKAVWWHLWVDRDSWSSDRPKWRDGSFHPLDAMLGRMKCTTETVEKRDVLVPMPEKSYPATAKLERYTWKRPRSPLSKELLRVTIDIPGGIPHEGKGESSWNCGTDATFGITTGECRTIPEGVGMLVGSVLRDRVRYGGWSDWTWSREEGHGTGDESNGGSIGGSYSRGGDGAASSPFGRSGSNG